jgi:hypothetical protein
MNLSIAFFNYVTRVVDLHQLIQAGRDEGQDGDRLRDEMDTWWYKMVPGEIERAGHLAEDLYYLDEAANERVMFDEQLWREIRAAMGANSWVRAIELIHQHRSEMPAFTFAFLQGICWAELGAWKPAREMLFEAHKRQPRLPHIAASYLGAALRAGIISNDLKAAAELAEKSDDASVILKAAEVIEAAADKSTHPNLEQLRFARDTAERGIRLAEEQGLDEGLKHQVVNALLQIAITSDLMGDTQGAQVACRRALELAPSNLDGYMVAGLLNVNTSGSNPVVRKLMTQRVREAGVHLVVPETIPLPASSIN